MSRALIPAALLIFTAACGGGSPTTPSSAATAGSAIQGQTVDAITGAASGNTTVALGAYRAVNTDASGNFAIDGQPGTYTTIVKGASIVERSTMINASGTSPLRLTVIPAAFDMAAFEEMFRGVNSRLQRWTTRPSLVVIATTMSFRSTSDDQFQTLSEQMTSDEVAQLVAQLNEGLALLTGNTFTSFASVEVERPPAGDRVTTIRNGKIVVGRFAGISTLASTIGYGRWADQGDGTITGGSMYLDRDVDYSDGRRRLLRMHELGHALGYQHVTSRTSIMNPALGSEPSEFDRAGALIAFQRLPGNRAPDVDPSGSVRLSVTSEGGSRWSAPVLCR